MSHPTPIANLHSEQAHDAILDGGSIVSRLIQSGCTEEELARAFPSIAPRELARLLRRLVRSGLVHKQGQVYEVAARLIRSDPQGTQMDYLSKLLIPALINLAMDAQEGVLLSLYLHLSEEEKEGLFDEKILGLYENLSVLAEESGEEGKERLLFVAGTSEFSRKSEGLDQALEILRQAALDRANPTRRPRAILSYFQTRLALLAKANQIILKVEEDLDSRKAHPSDANFVLLLGFGAVPFHGAMQ